MQTQTKNKTKINFDFSVMKGLERQVFEVINDCEFAALDIKLASSSVTILEKKLEVLIQDIEYMTSQDVGELMEHKKDEAIERLTHLQYYVFQEGFAKSIDGFIDMYVMSDMEEEIHAFRKLEVYFGALILELQRKLESIGYTDFVTKINSYL